ncbi:MAG TPA: hypothetical protein VJH21_02540 [Candidatus Paceibacterota bacterium]
MRTDQIGNTGLEPVNGETTLLANLLRTKYERTAQAVGGREHLQGPLCTSFVAVRVKKEGKTDILPVFGFRGPLALAQRALEKMQKRGVIPPWVFEDDHTLLVIPNPLPRAEQFLEKAVAA